MEGLNLYGGLGGNRLKWTGINITMVEKNEDIAEVYAKINPKDKIIIGDAHQYLLDHFDEFDFIWSSPPYYDPLVTPTAICGRHLFWSNFDIRPLEIKQPKNTINLATVAGKQIMMDWLGIHYDKNIYYEGNHCPA